MPSRRAFLIGVGAGVSALRFGRVAAAAGFRLSVITDEISQDLEIGRAHV